MGFRDLESFNKALLAKTAWRLIQKPDDLWCKILKGRYFPNDDFLRAKKGRRASWGWSSLLEGRDLLKKEFGWKLGNGRKINLWEDKWIVGMETIKLQASNITETEKKMVVADLIKEGQWNLSCISGRISEKERERVLKIQVPLSICEDRAIWMANKDGCYTVKSGYEVAKKSRKEEKPKDPSSSYVIPKQLWKCIWKIAVPPKIQHFLWRIAAGAVATKEALYKRSCADNPICPVCNAETETVEHLLFWCPWAKKCWFGSRLSLRVSRWKIRRIEDWLWEMLHEGKELDEYGKAILATMCWWIWKKRCNWVFRSELPDANEAIRLVNMQVDEYWKSKERIKGESGKVYMESHERLNSWKAPIGTSTKVNTDGSFLAKIGAAGIGVICRNNKGIFVSGMSKRVEANSPFMAECLALREALRNRKRFPETHLIFELDCEVLYRLVIGNSTDGCEWHSLEILQEILSLKESLQGVSFSLVARQGNKAADFLALSAAKEMYKLDWLDLMSFSLSIIVAYDSTRHKDSVKEKELGFTKEGIG